MRTLAIGMGAEGVALATALWKGVCDLDILVRPNRVAAWRNCEIARTGQLGRCTAPAGSFGILTSARQAARPYDYVVVATKAYDSAAVAQDLAHGGAVEPRTRIVLFQNGIGAAEFFHGRFSGRQIGLARVISGFRCVSPGHSEVTVHAGEILTGPSRCRGTSSYDALADALRRGGIPARATDEIWKAIWSKMLFNCAVNGPAAMWECKIGELADIPAARDLIRDLTHETFAVMQAEDAACDWDSAEDFLAAFYGKLLPATAGHRSSLWQDLQSGKNTEIDYLNGAVVRLGRVHGTPVPAHRRVVVEVRRLEKRAAVHCSSAA